jgi:hypothetical protein
MLLELKQHIQHTYPYWDRTDVSIRPNIVACICLPDPCTSPHYVCMQSTPGTTAWSLEASCAATPAHVHGHDHIWLSALDEGACWFTTACCKLH